MSLQKEVKDLSDVPGSHSEAEFSATGTGSRKPEKKTAVLKGEFIHFRLKEPRASDF